MAYNGVVFISMEASTKNQISVQHVSKFFPTEHGTLCALSDISFSVEEGCFVAILGASGCGKSTLLNMIAGLMPCDAGAIQIDESHLKQPERHRMMMFQEAALFPWYKVIENVMYGLRFKAGIQPKEYHDIALYYLTLVGLKNYTNARIFQLSGGMKQRVALARALTPNPKILLMDEPFSALDAMTCEQLYRDLQRIWQSQKKTILLVTHNVREAVVLAQKVIVLSPHPGSILDIVPIDLPFPRHIHAPEVSFFADKITQLFHPKT